MSKTKKYVLNYTVTIESDYSEEFLQKNIVMGILDESNILVGENAKFKVVDYNETEIYEEK